MRYINVPEPFAVTHPVTGEPLAPNGTTCKLEDAERVSFAHFVSVLVTLAAQSQNPPDPLVLIDLRNSVRQKGAGQLWECHDDWHKILDEQCKTARGVAAQTILSAEDHLRAIREAPSKAPAAVAALPAASAEAAS